jgi:hypothetical protein
MKRIAILAVLLTISVLVGTEVIGMVEANPVPFTQTPNLERPILTIMTPQNYSTYNTPNIPLNFTVKQPDSWGAPTFWNYIGKVDFVDVSLDGNLCANYSAYIIDRYFNGNKTTEVDTSGQFSVNGICDWINQTTPGMHTLNVTVMSHTYCLSQYPGSNVKAWAMYDGKPIYEYPIIVSDTIYFTVGSNDVINPAPSPTIPEFPIMGILLVLAVASVSLVYFSRRKKLTSKQSQ